MAATVLTVVTISTRNPQATGGDAWTWTAADAVNGNSYRATGRETVLVRNTGAVSHTLTITSVDDPLGRQENVSRSIAAGVQLAFEPGVEGWRGTDGYVLISADSTEVQFAVIRRPSR
jgi:hypothetical protein